MKKKIPYLLIFLLYLVWHFVYLDKFMRITIDDAYLCEPAWHFLKTGKFAVPTLKGIHELENYENRYGRIFIFSQLPFLAIFGPKPICVRFPALISGLLLLLMTYIFGNYVYGKKISILGTFLFSISGMFIITTHHGRPDTMFTLFIITALYLYLKAREKKNLSLFFLSGLISTLSLDVHLNGIMIFLTLGFLFLIEDKHKVLSNKHFWFWLSGAFCGCLWWGALHILLNPKLFFEQWKGVVMSSFPAPIFKTLNIFEWLKMELGRYSTWYWKTTAHRNMLELFIIVLSLIFMFAKKNKSFAEKKIIIFIYCFLLLFALIIPQKTSWYLVYLYPFFMLSIADMSVNLMILKNFYRKILVVCLILLYSLNILVWTIKYKNADYDSYVKSIKQYIPPNTSVMAGIELWFGFIEYAKYFSSLTECEFFNVKLSMSFPEYVKYWDTDYIIIEKDEREISLYKKNLSFLTNNAELIENVKTQFYASGLVTGEFYEMLIFKIKNEKKI